MQMVSKAGPAGPTDRDLGRSDSPGGWSELGVNSTKTGWHSEGAWAALK